MFKVPAFDEINHREHLHIILFVKSDLVKENKMKFKTEGFYFFVYLE
jgi:hypothetical protein